MNKARVLLWRMCSTFVIPLVTHDEKWMGFPFIKKSGLFHMGECLVREIVVLLFCEISTRVVAMAGYGI